MSTLLHRLAGQAIGAPASRVRAAERTRAYVPIAMPAEAAPRVDEALRLNAAAMPSSRRAHPSSGSAATPPISPQMPTSGAPAGPMPELISSPDVTPSEVIAPASLWAQVPAPLLEEVAHAAPVTVILGSIQPAARPSTMAARSEDRSEVHVHIGRIEVTAIPSPAAPARKRDVAPRRSVPLSDYLAKRRAL